MSIDASSKILLTVDEACEVTGIRRSLLYVGGHEILPVGGHEAAR